jgi:hypothetical protein
MNLEPRSIATKVSTASGPVAANLRHGAAVGTMKSSMAPRVGGGANEPGSACIAIS